MTGDELEQLLGDAFDARARAAVPDHAAPPAPRFEDPQHTVTVLHPHRRRRLVAPLLAAAAVVAAVAVGVGVTRSGSGGDASGHHRPTTLGLTAPAAAQRAGDDAQQVHVRLHMDEGQTYGVGMPVIAYFSQKITDARNFQLATTVTVNGKPIDAQWYFEPSKAQYGPLEAHLRPENYWPPHARIHVAIASAGLSGGSGTGFDDSLVMNFRTGAYTEVRVVAATHTLTVYHDSNKAFACPVALGSSRTPTMRGTKVVMQKNPTLTVSAPASRSVVKYAQRLTYSGEYLLGAAWLDSKNIAHTASEGSTDTTVACAQKLYAATRVGDLVTYPDASGQPMTLGLGYGDWNVSWTEWRSGGAVRTH